MNDQIHFFGDSHLRPVQAAVADGRFGSILATICSVGGATAVGLRHPTSKTEAFKLFRSELAKRSLPGVPIFQLGEVDCGFVIWVRAQRHGESVTQQLRESLAAYGSFLCEVRDQGLEKPIVTSATLPTICDGQLDGEVAHLRREVRASYRERTDLTLEYNRRLEAFCASEGLDYADLTPRLLNAETRLLDERFRHPDFSDHHLNPLTGGDVWVEVIQAALARRATANNTGAG